MIRIRINVSMRRKIFLYYILLIIIGVSITGFFISELSQRFYKHEVEQRLITTASLIDYQLAEKISRNESIDYNREALSYAGILSNNMPVYPPLDSNKCRVTFIDFQGNVLGESDKDYHTMENHLDRKEIREAIEGKVGMDTRFSKTLQIDLLYVAVPIESARMVVRVSVPLVQLKTIDEIIWLYAIFGILAGLLLTALLAFKFSSSITRPINELISVSRKIAEGKYSKRADVKSPDELGQLAYTFNEMAQVLEKTVADLTVRNTQFDSVMNSMTNGIVAVDDRFRIILINSIACRFFHLKDESEVVGKNFLEVIRNNQINVFLADAAIKNIHSVNEITVNTPEEKIFRVYANPIHSKSNPEIVSGGILSIHDITTVKKLEQIRTEFVSNVTHELKTPLTSIRGFVETLRSGALHDGEVADKFLEIIDIEAERLYMLINDILQLSEIENRQKDSNIGTYNLKGIVDETVSILQGSADKKGVALKVEVDAGLKIHANRDRIKQMLINLVDNAIKYNVEHGSVYVKACKSEGKIILTVKDTGIGIAQEHLQRIFERFYRVDKGRSRSMGGTGLGLSIVKHIVNLYSGDIRVNSTPGEGTEFVIQLPA